MKVKYIKKSFLITIILLVVIILYLKLSNYSRTEMREFIPYISAYTGGLVQEDAEIRVEFVQNISEERREKVEKQKILKFSPRLKGELKWENSRTLVFTPDSGALRAGKRYQATLELGKILEVPERLKQFKFDFFVQERAFNAQVEQILVTTANPDFVEIRGKISFNSRVEKGEVEKMITASFLGQKLEVKLEKISEGDSYQFVIPEIEKQTTAQPLTICVEGKPARIDDEVVLTVEIPKRGEFYLLSAQVVHQQEMGVALTFSEPLSENQELEGMVTLSDDFGVEIETIFQRDENRLTLFFDKQSRDRVNVELAAELRSSTGNQLDSVVKKKLSLLLEGPKVEILSDGFILPNSDSLLLPFRAKALKAVDIQIIQVYENNILSYLREDQWGRMNNLKRYGRLVYKQTLRLAPTDAQSWGNYSLDLKKLISQESGAIYKVIFTFNQSYAMEPFNGGKKMEFERENGMIAIENGVLTETDEATWNFNDGYIGYFDEGIEIDWQEYNWRETENPMCASYYMERANVVTSTQILASNIGMIVKSNDQNEHWIFVTDILTAKPIRSAQVTLYSSQLQELTKGVTDSEGFVLLKSRGKALFAVAQYQQEKSYVKLVDGESNSTSRFDVGGSQLSKGLKGFIYGERGVWRPGDTLFLSFMLQDKNDKIPENHPVTMEVYNPLGQLMFKEMATNSANGLYVFAVPTEARAQTGSWKAYVKVGSSTFTKSLLVEAVKPNRLKVELALPEGKFLDMSKPIAAKLHSQWLTGASARNLKAKVELNIESQKTTFKGFERYVFDNPTLRKMQIDEMLFDANLDPNGNAQFTIENVVGKQAPGLLTATFVCRVFEAGGDASIHSQTAIISPYDCYVGVELKNEEGQFFDLSSEKEHRFKIVTTSPSGRLIDADSLEYKIYKTDWSWWWENDYREFSSYINATSVEPISSGKLRTIKGKAVVPFRADSGEAGTYLIYIVDRKGGHATGGVFTVDSRSGFLDLPNGSASAYKILPFTTDKQEYAPGDRVEVYLPEVSEGHALITIENGQEVLRREWVDVAEKNSYSFEATADMSPNVYVHIILLQKHSQTVNDHPIRMYGVKPIMVHDKNTLLNPEISVPKIVRPESTFTAKIKEKNGKKMTYTLAIVDEGLLGLTNFQTPDPWNYFNAKEALGVRTWDMFDQVIGSFTGKYGSLFSVGGDQALKRGQNGISRFKPVVKFLGPFELKANGENIHKISLPQYIGDVRVMVVALGDERAYGSTEQNIKVKAPLMLLSTLPRVVSVEESIELPVNVFAMEEQIKDVKVSVKTTGKLKSVGSHSQNVKFAKTGDKTLFFNLKSSDVVGNEKVIITATANGFTAHEEIEIEVRNPNPYYTRQVHQLITAGSSATLAYHLLGVQESNSLSLQISRLPNPDLTRRLEFLENYQHSCTEQITSKAVPWLYLGTLQSLTANNQQLAEQRVEEALKTIYSRQAVNGGFVYWAGDREANPWITAYIGHFLLAAREKGFAVDADVLKRWIQYQKNRVKNGADTYEVRAYQLYTLALAQNADIAAMNRMRETKELTSVAKWCLAGAYAASGMKNIAQELTFNLSTNVNNYWGGITYGSALRDEALILEVMLLIGKKELAFEQAQQISNRLLQEEIFNTYSTAMALMALSKLSEESSGTMSFAYQFEGAESVENSTKTIWSKSLKGAKNKGVVALKNRGKGTLYASLITRAQPLMDTLPAVNNSLKIEVNYTDLNGNQIDVNSLPKSTDFFAYIKISNTHHSESFSDLALTYRVPSGWEIYNENLFFEKEKTEKNFDYQEIRDDMVLTYLEIPNGRTKIIKLRLQASYAGEFNLPAITCESMSNPNAYARTAAKRIIVETNF